MLFLNLYRVPNENTNLDIQIKEDPKFDEEVENFFSKDHQTLPNDKVGKKKKVGRKKNDEDKHIGDKKNTSNKKYNKKFTDMNADYMNFVGRNRNDKVKPKSRTAVGVKHNGTLNKKARRNKDGKKSTKMNTSFFQALQMKIPFHRSLQYNLNSI